jgi:hypothetical protein
MATDTRELPKADTLHVSLYGPINKTIFSETKDGGVIHRMPNIVEFREDLDAMLVLSLEEYDEVTGKAAKAAILKKDVVGKTPPVTQLQAAEEGLLVSLNHCGTVDLPFICELYGKPWSQVIADLGDLIFPAPESRTWQTADAYLSGDMRAELAAAQQASLAFARGTQQTFCDMGVNPTLWGYSAYEEIAGNLIAAGIPHQQIAPVGEADSVAKKQSLFEKVKSGQVRVLLGQHHSTTKIGLGTNVQKRLVALHHLDAPWKLAEVEQREGRILRQGNQNEEVAIYRYVTEGRFDPYMWQALETKAKFIAQVMTGENAVRSAQDIGGEALPYAEVKAIASGNPAVLTLAEADAEQQRLSLLKKQHADEHFLARRNFRLLPDTTAGLTERLASLTADLDTMKARADDPLTIAGRTVLRDDAVAALGQAFDALPYWVTETRRFPLGTYRGLRFGMALHPPGAPDAYLEGKARRQSMLSRDHHGPRAVLNALDRLAGGYGFKCDRTRQDLGVAVAQLRDYQ